MEPVEAIPADRDDVIRLWRDCGLTRPWNDPERDFGTALANPTSTVLLIRAGQALAGSVMVGFDGHRGWVYYLAVAPNYRRQGLGRRLMVASEAWLRQIGAPKIQLMVRDGNDAALGFFRSLGLEQQDVLTLGRFLDPPEGIQTS